MATIDHSKKCIAEITALALDVIGIVKAPQSAASYIKIVKMAAEIFALAQDAYGALPELKDLQGAEMADLLEAIKAAAIAIAAAVAGK